MQSQISNSNRTIDEMTKELSSLKLTLLKKNTEIEELKSAPSGSNSNNDNLINELKAKIESQEKEINKKNQEKIRELNQLQIEITKLKIENKSLLNKIKDASVTKTEDKKDEKKDDVIITKNTDGKSVEELKKQNEILVNKLVEAQNNIQKANHVIGKAKKYNICIAYLSKFIKDIKPNGQKETFLYEKLKSIVENEEKEKEKEKEKMKDKKLIEKNEQCLL